MVSVLELKDGSFPLRASGRHIAGATGSACPAPILLLSASTLWAVGKSEWQALLLCIWPGEASDSWLGWDVRIADTPWCVCSAQIWCCCLAATCSKSDAALTLAACHSFYFGLQA